MEKYTPEEIVAMASVFSIQLSKNCSMQQIQTYRTFFQAVSNDLQTIINQRKNN